VTLSDQGTVVRLPGPLRSGISESTRPSGDVVAVVGLVVAAAATVFLDGLYDLRHWAPVALMLLALAFAAAITGRRPAGTPAYLACAGLAALLLWSALSMTWADSVDRAWTEVNRLLLYVGILVVGLALMRTRAARVAASNALGAAVGLIAGATAIQVASGDAGAFVSNRLDAPVDYINGSAGLFLMGVWPLVAVAERARSSLLAGIALGGVVIEGNLLVLTQSRAIVPALIVSSVVLLALVPGRTVRAWAVMVAGAAVAGALPWTLDVFAQRDLTRAALADGDLVSRAGVAALLSAAVAMFAWAAVRRSAPRIATSRIQQLSSPAAVACVVVALAAGLVAVGNPVTAVRDQWDRFAANEVDQSATVRFTDASGFRHDLWRVALEQFGDQPLRGVGAGSYGLTYFQRRDNGESVRQPHSIELQVLAELGIVGGCAFVLFVAGLWQGFARRRHDVPVAVGCGGVAVVWLVDTSVDWLWNLPGLTCLALLAAASLVVAQDDTTAASRSALVRTKPFAVVAAIVVALGSASLGRQFVADRYRLEASSALASDPATSLRDTRRSLQLNPASMEAHYVRAAAFARYGDYSRARATLLRAVGREPTNFVPWGLLGDLAARRGDLRAAAVAYRNAARLNPGERQLRELIENPAAAVR
jgi:hypothetical protein